MQYLCINLIIHVLGWPKSPLYFFAYGGPSNTSLSLTSFETIVLDCVVTAVISACARKKKIGVFLCSHFNIGDGRMQLIWCIMFYYFKKGKKATEMQERCVQCMEKVL